jgi:hypothetical protein
MWSPTRRDPGSRGFVSAIVLAQMLARVGAFALRAAARRDQESVRPLHDQEMIVMKLPQAGGCHCGKIRYEVTEAPQLVYTCHCTDCQRITGTAFSLGVALPETAFRLTVGEPRALQRMPESSRLNTRFVCPDCASWVYSLPRGGVIFVRAGTLDDTSWLRPTRHIWTRSKQPWVAFAEGDEIFEAQPSEEIGPGSR